VQIVLVVGVSFTGDSLLGSSAVVFVVVVVEIVGVEIVGVGRDGTDLVEQARTVWSVRMKLRLMYKLITSFIRIIFPDSILKLSNPYSNENNKSL